ncbi:class I adenylate-forming enzyme family protein [Aquisalimonas lutea]|uniref:class I adenylate-forming enzyme family protein n=1 Tax=Aquisalimonas lutea TaxID=1327750 RepID=UPI0025B4E7C4|nr:class I adenylate-forming enzyme family protein [Aquisalimonas lutea]MDN3519779.1 class I adenylate-forming enzyme family protein [Aquisalimonas lutea]
MPRETSVAEFVFQTASQSPERIALGNVEEHVTYRELASRVARLAAGLRRLGLSRGDRIGVLTTPRADAYTLFLAANAIGVTWLGINPKHTYREMDYVVQDAQPAALFFISELEGRKYRDDVRRLASDAASVKATVSLDDTATGATTLSSLYEEPTSPHPSELGEDMAEDAALLVYTSGSTGSPKGVLLQNKAMIRRSLTQLEHWPLSDPPVIYNSFPMNHIGGMHFLSCYAMVGRGAIHFREKFEADTVPDLVHDLGINILLLLPTMYQLIASSPNFDVAKFASVQWFVFSGAQMPREILRRLRAAGGRIGTSYGMTETCGSVTYGYPDEDLDTLAITIGRSVPNGEVRVHKEDGTAAAEGEKGEIQVRPEYCMAGYLNRPEATRDTYTEDGWLKTGDLVEVMPRGNLRFVGRTSEMFKSGGYNVYPREIELTIEAKDGVDIAAVVAVPDQLYSEIGYAFVVPRSDAHLDETELRDWCREQLANYKIPKRIFVRDSLPMLAIGKVDKVKLRQELLAEEAE